ncbi:MAG: sensor histidine kinase [Alphaproteobacteria bacterium]|nr:sensor histidine kinase [Alphaproteobacteria bacterium]
MGRLSPSTRLVLLIAVALAPAAVVTLVRETSGGMAAWLAPLVVAASIAAALAACWVFVRGGHGGRRIDAALQAHERELQASLAQRDLLLRELHHRVKNNLQMISSLLSLQGERIRSPRIRRIFADAQNRVLTLSLLHRHLYERSNWTQVDFRAFLNDLVQHLSRTHERVGGPTVRIEVDAAVAPVGPDIAIPVGLIVTEAVSNAMRHAFAETAAPRIAVAFRDSGARFELSVDDNGVGIAPAAVPPGDGDGLGFTLLRGLVAQLGGDMAVAPRAEGGTRVRVTFAKPADDQAAPP